MKTIISYAFIYLLMLSSINIFAQELPVTSGLQLYLPLNNTTQDMSGNNNNVSSVGISATADIDGNSAHAYHLDLGNYIQISSNLGYSEWTISVWIKPQVPISENTPYNGIMSIIQGDSDNELLGISNQGLCLNTTTIVQYSFEADKWYHVVYSYDGNNLTAYINNETHNTIVAANPFSELITRRIGAREQTGRLQQNQYTGDVDEITIYNRVLNQDEIQQLYYMPEATQPRNNISNSDVLNWNTAYSWGNHSTAGYLKTDINNNLKLPGAIIDTSGSVGSSGQVLSSTVDGVKWVNTGTLGQWKIVDGKLNLVDETISDILFENDKTSGFTNIMVKNSDETGNYSGALIKAKGSGSDYTNTIYMGRFSNNFYINSWAGNGVLATDKDLVLAAVGNKDTLNPNPDARIIFQTGGYYEAPEHVITRMVLDENGNLGIGTSNPDEKLTVKGKIHTEEVIIDLKIPAPDYVFEKNYPIKSLDELERYIKRYKHLPDIPSAVEFQRKGLSVSEMNMKLLQKVEELTLYVIKLHKEIEVLKKKKN